MTPSLSVRTVDYHTAGEPFRIILGGMPAIPGETVGARRVFAQRSEEIDRYRRLLCNEPRGHADMYGGFIVPPDDDGADLGVLFWHKDGFSTACGHGTIALGAWAVESGLVEAADDGVTTVTVDVPSGRVAARVERVGGRTTRVTFRNVPSYVIARGVTVSTSRGDVLVDLSYSGAIYASLRAADVGLAVTPEDYTELIAIGREVKWLLNDSAHARHPSDERLSGVYGTILFDELAATPSGPRQRNVTVFADGEVDRSPCGSGTGARVALLADDGTLLPEQTLRHESIVGTVFEAGFENGPAADHGVATVVPEVTGSAHKTGEHLFVLDADDELGTGFVLR
nr:proline racemase family protein [Leifsonia sp. Root4]